MTCAMNTSEKKYVKIFILETTPENKRRLVGPTFHQPQEAYHFLVENQLAWPGDQGPLDLDLVRAEGLLKAWSRVWSADVEACVRTSAESVERFVENFNSTSSLYVRLPKTFLDQLITKTHQEAYSIDPAEVRYEIMSRGYFFPDQPPEDSDGTDLPSTPIHRRVYAFTKILVTVGYEEATKYGFVRNRVKGDQYFVAVTPDFEYEDVDELRSYFVEDTSSYPSFNFDAKWMLQDIIQNMPDMA